LHEILFFLHEFGEVQLHVRVVVVEAGIGVVDGEKLIVFVVVVARKFFRFFFVVFGVVF
jgi:hypothetical protein